ncbi:hypothetical protein V8D89_004257 [Ganoderma adspersum]
MSTLFSSELLEKFRLPRTLHWSNLEETDRLFYAINQLYLDRDWDIWKTVFPIEAELALMPSAIPFFSMQQWIVGGSSSLLSHAPSPLSDSGDERGSNCDQDLPNSRSLGGLSSENLELIVIQTSFNATYPNNVTSILPSKPGIARKQWTDKQQEHAQQAAVSQDIAELRSKLQETFYIGEGIKEANTYVQIEETLFEGKTLRLDALDSSLLAIIFGNTPEHIRAMLTTNLEMALGASATNPTLKAIRMSEDLDSFPAFHFAYYSRMATKGTKAPRDAHPLYLKWAGKLCTNHTQMTPYPSKDIMLNNEEYNNLCNAFDKFFEFMEQQQLKKYLPQTSFNIAVYASRLPGYENCLAYPLAGFVLNINVAAYLVLPVGSFSGGELCLEEPGLVVPLRSGDFFVFPSYRVTHFNLHYSGARASLVCHSDKAGIHWRVDRLQWEGNTYLEDESRAR